MSARLFTLIAIIIEASAIRLHCMNNIASKVVRIAVGSRNIVKINSAELGISTALNDPSISCQAIGYNVPSGVSDQPMNDSETKEGAIARAKAAFSHHFAAEGKYPTFAVGLEGGVALVDGQLECFAWIIIIDANRMGAARTASFVLPERIRDLIVIEGKELGDADDQVFGSINSKQQGGSVGHLTNGIIDRTAYYQHAVILAMIPFIQPDLYPQIEL